MNILIVEDSPDLQNLLRQLFTAEGYTVTLASDGREALSLLRVMPKLPSLILLDIMMPVMDGLTFRTEQMNDARLAKVPVVVMTADTNSLPKARALGVVEFVSKPIVDVYRLVEIASRVRVSS